VAVWAVPGVGEIADGAADGAPADWLDAVGAAADGSGSVPTPLLQAATATITAIATAYLLKTAPPGSIAMWVA
jgi:hypothetical protein